MEGRPRTAAVEGTPEHLRAARSPVSRRYEQPGTPGTPAEDPLVRALGAEEPESSLFERHGWYRQGTAAGDARSERLAHLEQARGSLEKHAKAKAKAEQKAGQKAEQQASTARAMLEGVMENELTSTGARVTPEVLELLAVRVETEQREKRRLQQELVRAGGECHDFEENRDLLDQQYSDHVEKCYSVISEYTQANDPAHKRLLGIFGDLEEEELKLSAQVQTLKNLREQYDEALTELAVAKGLKVKLHRSSELQDQLLSDTKKIRKTYERMVYEIHVGSLDLDRQPLAVQRRQSQALTEEQAVEEQERMASIAEDRLGSVLAAPDEPIEGFGGEDEGLPPAIRLARLQDELARALEEKELMLSELQNLETQADRASEERKDLGEQAVGDGRVCFELVSQLVETVGWEDQITEEELVDRTRRRELFECMLPGFAEFAEEQQVEEQLRHEEEDDGEDWAALDEQQGGTAVESPLKLSAAAAAYEDFAEDT